MSVPIWWQKQILREKLLMSGFDNEVAILRTIGEGFDQLLYRTLVFFFFFLRTICIFSTPELEQLSLF